MRLEIVAVGKLRDKPCRTLMDDYMGRLRRYGRFEMTEIKESKLTPTQLEVGLAQEAESFRRCLQPDSISVAMDERGEDWTSVELSEQLQRWMNQSVRHVAFFIGSANGLDVPFRQECNHRLRLSAMTLPHEIARVILAEQLYRAMTILANEPYHK